jgi:hypothetical protein
MKIKYPLLPSQLVALMKNRTEAPLFNQTENYGKTPTTDVVRFKTRLNEYAMFGGTLGAAGSAGISGTGTGTGTGGSGTLYLTPADLISPMAQGSIPGSADGFEVISAGTSTAVFSAYLPSTLDPAIANWTIAGGYNFNAFSYVVTAVFNSYTPPAPGSATIQNYSALVRFVLLPGGFQFVPIDQTDSIWMTGGFGLALAGRFTFPVTLGIYSPVTTMGNNGQWC